MQRAFDGIFDRAMEFDPSGDLDIFLKSVPGKWAVYLMTGADDRPVQLLCVKNLRYSLERRLGVGEVEEGPSRRVNYREIVRRVYWRRVDSTFEADAVYLEAARRVFPETYRGMHGMRPAWWVHVNPETTFPRYVKTIDPTGKTGRFFGPVEDKHAGQKLVHLMESLFDLCRDYSVLTQSPNGGPCAWRQMGKCVGPCDGSVGLGAYGALVAFSARVLASPGEYVREQSGRMQQASKALRFEEAEKIKVFVEELGQLGKGSFRHVRALDELVFVTLQRGPRAGTAKVFVLTPGRIDEVAGLIGAPQSIGELLRWILTLAQDRQPIDEAGVERMGVVAHHLFQPKAKQGVFIPIESVDEKAILKAFSDLQKQKSQEDAVGEGVTKELQAL